MMKLIVFGLMLLFTQSCVRDKDRSNKDGDLELFELRADQRHYSDDFREGARHKFDDSEHVAPLDIGDWHDYVDRGYRANQINRRVTDEPAISYAELNRVSSCPVPRLNTSSPVLASGIQWEVFFYCQTGLSATGEFPDMPALKSRHAAFRFARAVLAKFASRNWHLIRNMTLEDKVKIFEGHFIGTKLRPMTNAEKVKATRLVRRAGLVVATAAYLYNWYDSEFYHKHFDYSEARSPRYNSTRILGTVYDAGGLPKAGASYALDSTTLAGFKTSGVSAPAFEIIRRKRVDYNYSIQVYVPISDDKYTGTKRNPDLALSARFERLSANALIKANGDELVKNVALRLSATPANIATWPDVDRITNSHLAGLSYALGNGTATCPAPVVQNNLVDGYQWQDFIACVFGARVRDVVPGLNSDYLPLITTRSAVEMLGVYVMGYLRSDAGINDKPEIIASKILTVVTLQQPAGAALDKIKASISSLGLDLTLASLVQNWYLSATYARFNFAGANVIPRDRYNISGIVKDQAGTVLPGVTVSVLDFRGQEVADGLSDANGRFTVIYRYLAVSDETRFKSFSIKPTKAGYSAGSAVLAADGIVDKIITLNLLQDGVSIPGQSGKVVSADSKVTIEVPAGAVTELNSFQISGVAQTLAQDFNNAKIMMFNAGPSYQFLKHVKVSFKLDQDFVNQAPPLTRWVLLTQNSQGKWEKLRNNYYDAATGTVSGLTHHFSIFIAIDSASVFCYFDSASVQNLCYPTDPLVLSRSALADIADRNKGVYFPEGIPSLLTQGRNLLVAGGWDTSAIDNVASNQQVIDGMQSMNLPATCLTSSCPTIPFPATVSANGQTYNLSGGSRFLIDIEAQRCTQNPTASIPQPQLNGVRATDINVDATTNTVDNLSHTAYYSYTACVGSGWRRFCYPQYGSYTEYHSVPITHGARIRNYNHAYDRNFAVSPIAWNDGAVLHATDSSPIYSPGPVPGDANSALWTNTLHNFVVDNMNTYWGQNVAPAEANYVANTYLPQYVTSQLNSLTLADPVWNADNCFPAAPANGVPQWVRQSGSPNKSASAQDVAIDSAGYAYVIGGTNGAVNGAPLIGSYDGFVSKYNPGGVLVWTKMFGSPGAVTELRRISIGSTGELYIVGATTGTIGGQTARTRDALLMKVDMNGEILWARLIPENISGSGGDGTVGTGVAISPNGNIYIAASTRSGFDDKPPLRNSQYTAIGLAAFDPAGVKIFTKLHQFESVAPTAITVLSNGSIIVAAAMNSNHGLLISYDGSGNVLGLVDWAFVAGTDRNIPNRLVPLLNGDFVTAGTISVYSHLPLPYPTGVDGQFLTNPYGDFAVTRHKPNLQRSWFRTFANGVPAGLAVGPGNAILVSGYSFWGFDSFAQKGTGDIAMVSMDENGNKLWSSTYGVPNVYAFVSGAALNAGGVGYIVGGTYGSLLGATQQGALDAFLMQIK